MAEEKVAEKSERKMVPLSDLIAERKKRQQIEAQINALNQEIKGLKAEVSVARRDMDDDDVAVVKRDLIEREKAIAEKEAMIEQQTTSFKEREKEVRAKEIVADYKSKGVLLDLEEVQAEEDMERFALTHYADYLAGEKEKLEEKGQTPEAYESSPGGKAPRNITKMSDAEFAQLEAEMKAEALSK